MRGLASPVAVLALVASAVGALAVKNGVVVPAYDRIDELANPAVVVSWSGSSLLLADRRTVALPNVARIVGANDEVERVVRLGVEVTARGRVLVVVPVYSERDTHASFVYRTRRLKVDLSALLVVLELAEPDTAFAAAEPWGGCWLHHARDRLARGRPFRLGFQTHCELESVCARAGVSPPAHVERVFAGFRW